MPQNLTSNILISILVGRNRFVVVTASHWATSPRADSRRHSLRTQVGEQSFAQIAHTNQSAALWDIPRHGFGSASIMKCKVRTKVSTNAMKTSKRSLGQPNEMCNGCFLLGFRVFGTTLDSRCSRARHLSDHEH